MSDATYGAQDPEPWDEYERSHPAPGDEHINEPMNAVAEADSVVQARELLVTGHKHLLGRPSTHVGCQEGDLCESPRPSQQSYDVATCPQQSVQRVRHRSVDPTLSSLCQPTVPRPRGGTEPLVVNATGEAQPHAPLTGIERNAVASRQIFSSTP